MIAPSEAMVCDGGRLGGAGLSFVIPQLNDIVRTWTSSA
jgi:hypothetical protein